jgi:hypothetical protein
VILAQRLKAGRKMGIWTADFSERKGGVLTTDFSDFSDGEAEA